MAVVSDIKVKNTIDIVREVRTKGPISKPAIAKSLGLTNPAVHNFINELMEEGVVVEEGIADSNGGRKAILYSINPEYGYFIGQSIGLKSISTHIFDLSLKQVYSHSFSISQRYHQKTIDTMCIEIEEALRSKEIPKERCFGVGISVPGLVDFDSGVIKDIPHMSGWTSVPIQNYVEQKLGIKTIVDNDANAFALVSKWVYDLPDSGLVALTIEHGIGAGVISKGSLYRGSKSTAGEIGHTTVNYDGPKCWCGNRGCMDIYVSANTIIKEMTQVCEAEISHVSQVVELMRQGDESAEKVMNSFADYVAIALDCIFKLYAPEYVVIYNDWVEDLQELRYRIIDQVFARNKWVHKNELEIRFSTMREHLQYSGAIQVLEYIFTGEDKTLFCGRRFS